MSTSDSRVKLKRFVFLVFSFFYALLLSLVVSNSLFGSLVLQIVLIIGFGIFIVGLYKKQFLHLAILTIIVLLTFIFLTFPKKENLLELKKCPYSDAILYQCPNGDYIYETDYGNNEAYLDGDFYNVYNMEGYKISTYSYWVGKSSSTILFTRKAMRKKIGCNQSEGVVICRRGQ